MDGGRDMGEGEIDRIELTLDLTRAAHPGFHPTFQYLVIYIIFISIARSSSLGQEQEEETMLKVGHIFGTNRPSPTNSGQDCNGYNDQW